MTDPIPSDQANYKICVKGHLGERWSLAFEGLELRADYSSDGSPITVLTGPIVDQSALYGLVARIRDLGLTLILIKRLGSEPNSEGSLDSHEFQ